MDDLFLGLYPTASHAAGAVLDVTQVGRGDGSLAHNVRTPETVDRTMAEAEAAGATVTRSASETPWGGYSGYFTDTDGHLWEVAAGADFAEELI